MVGVRVACVQATPVILDAEASVAKACDLIGEAGARGAKLIVLPEVFVSLYPSSAWAYTCARFTSTAAEVHRRMWAGSIDVPGPLTERLGAAARRSGAWAVIGVNERDSERPGTLWNALLFFAPDGSLALRRRKLMPTLHERVFWGQGDGDDLVAVPTAFGRVGGLICWENYMPAARQRLHREGVDFYLAPTADDSERWVCAMRAFAFEAGAFVISPTQYLPKSAFPADFPAKEELDAAPDPLLQGASLICDPWGNLLAGPVADREEILYADCDLGAVVAARRVFDSAGHYQRPDVLGTPG